VYTDVNQRVARVHLRRLRLADHYVDKGGPGGPGRPPNGLAKKKGRGYFYQMSNMYTCIAYLIEIRKFCSKNLVHKGVNFEVQNALKTHTRAPLISKNFRGLYPRTPVKRGREKDEREGQGRGAPPIHIPGYPTVADCRSTSVAVSCILLALLQIPPSPIDHLSHVPANQREPDFKPVALRTINRATVYIEPG